MGHSMTATKTLTTLGIQSDAAFTEAAKQLRGRDLCSIADLSVQEMAAIMELAHAGFHASGVASIGAACRVLAQSTPDALVMDYRLYDGTAGDLAERCPGILPRIRIILTREHLPLGASEGFHVVVWKAAEWADQLVGTLRALASSELDTPNLGTQEV